MSLLTSDADTPRHDAITLLRIEAYAWLGIMRLAIHLLPFRSIVRWFRLSPVESSVVPTGAESKLAERIGRAVVECARTAPWHCTCFTQALAGMAMLRRRSISGTLYLGVAGNESRNLASLSAHAWTCCGTAVLSGAHVDANYARLASYSW